MARSAALTVAVSMLLTVSGCCFVASHSLADRCSLSPELCAPLEGGLDFEAIDARFVPSWSAYECGGRIVVQETYKDSFGTFFFERDPPHELVGIRYWPCRSVYGDVDPDCVRVSSDEFRCSPATDESCLRSCESDTPFVPRCPSE